MVRSGMGPGPDDQEPLIKSVEQAGAKNAGEGEGEGVGVTENGESAHESGEHTKVEEGMEVEVAGKSLVEDRARGPNAIAGKSSVEDRAGGPAGVAEKSLDVTVGVSGGAARSETTIAERLEAPVISGTRVPITSNLNNPALVSPPFVSPRLGTGMGASTLASPVAPRRGSVSLFSFTRTPKTTRGPQVPLQGQKPHHATLETSARPFEDTQDLKMYEGFLAADDDDDL